MEPPDSLPLHPRTRIRPPVSPSAEQRILDLLTLLRRLGHDPFICVWCRRDHLVAARSCSTCRTLLCVDCQTQHPTVSRVPCLCSLSTEETNLLSLT